MAKTMSFACVHFCVAFSVGYALTGSWVSGGLIAMVEPAVNTIAYYLHEKVWYARAKREVSDSLRSEQRGPSKLQPSSPALLH
ncbi:MAG: DUF2061 domain-containing protein [Pseudomonadota bacterium]|nr:DUF2061 domain-containing protein [Pseudomonadota bacterium]